MEEQRDALKAAIQSDQVRLSHTNAGSQAWEALIVQIRENSSEADRLTGEIVNLSSALAELRAGMHQENRAYIYMSFGMHPMFGLYSHRCFESGSPQHTQLSDVASLYRAMTVLQCGDHMQREKRVLAHDATMFVVGAMRPLLRCPRIVQLMADGGWRGEGIFSGHSQISQPCSRKPSTPHA